MTRAAYLAVREIELDQVAAPTVGLVGDQPAAATPRGLADRSELAVIALERTRMPMVVTDPRQMANPIVMANRAFLNLTGYSATEVLGRDCSFLQGDKTDRGAVSEIREAIAEHREVTVEILNYRKDGTTFWNQLCLSPVHDDGGALLYFLVSQLDVSERRRAEELEAVERRLLREIDHRTMNVLAIVQGIVRMTRKDDVAEYAASVDARVQSLSQVHGLLAAGGWRAVPLLQLIQLQIEPYGGRRVVIAGPDVQVHPQIAQSVGLVVHELIANTARHGALSSPCGEVSIHWGEDDREGLKVRWNETGAPPPAENPAEGFGFKMMDATIGRQLGGRLTREWKADGLDTAFSIPLRDAALGA